jgi:phospholipid/cholesterol/gamma-HCH transport system substrate-binding protein
LNQQNAQLNHLVDDAAPVADAVAADKGKRLDSLVGSTTQTLSITAAQQQALRSTLQQLPSSLASARRTLAQLAGTADPAANTLADIRPTTDNLRDISGELRHFADAADPALGSLPPVLDRAKDLLDEARPVAENLRVSGGNLRGTSDGLHRLVGNFLDLRFTDVMELLKGWSLATSDYDSISHYFKANLVFDPKTSSSIVAGPIPGMTRTPIPGGLPMPAPLQPRLDELGKPITPPGSTERPKQGPNAGATGLTPNQEDSMMGQLLGGN